MSSTFAVLLPWSDCLPSEQSRLDRLRAEAQQWAEAHEATELDLLESNLPLLEIKAQIESLPGEVVLLIGTDRTWADALPWPVVELPCGESPEPRSLLEKRVLRERRFGLAPAADAQCGDSLTELENAMRSHLDTEKPG